MLPMLNNLILAIAMSSQLAATAPAQPERIVIAVPELPSSSHAYLGVGLRDVTDDRVAELKLKDSRGVEVIALDHDGPAAKVGMREHDVILQMNGQEIASAEQLHRIMRETPAGRKAEFVLSREGQQMNMEVVLGDRQMSEHAALGELPELNLQLHNMANGMSILPDIDVDLGDIPMGMGAANAVRVGAQVESLGPQLARYFGAKDGVGVLVKEVRPDSPAAKAGLKAGDVIVRAAGQPVSGRVEWDRILRDHSGAQVSVEVLREKREQKLMLAVAKRDQSSNSFEGVGPDGQYISMQSELTPQQEQEIAESVEKAAQEMELHRGDIDKAAREVELHQADIDKAMAEMKAKMDSPEFKAEMAKASDEAAQAAAEFQNSEEWRDQMKQAEVEARKAADEWKQNPKMQEEMQQEMQKAQEEMQKAAEQVREQMTPMD